MILVPRSCFIFAALTVSFGSDTQYCYGKFSPRLLSASQRAGTDIDWCCAFVKRMVWETSMVQFSPKFIISIIPAGEDSRVLVSRMSEREIAYLWTISDPITRNMIFRGLNDMHYARDETSFN
ncbi:Importin-beta domain containing hypothetical protein [Phytophthora palmivora]|uniref:Uncharacterized protein n=1 Tax=Phytophthora palmivora TaxID=4796 RepID=A0A2P4YVK1_9STRA|nr:Importin-beta domain containing hypothetical protein [Phytophthora palmivora]